MLARTVVIPEHFATFRVELPPTLGLSPSEDDGPPAAAPGDYRAQAPVGGTLFAEIACEGDA